MAARSLKRLLNKRRIREMATNKSPKTTSKTTKAATKANDAIRPRRKTIMWINHFDLLPGDPSVTTSFDAVSSGVGGGLTGLVIQSSTTGENAQGGGNKVVHMGLEVPPKYLIKGVRVCYELSDIRSFISQIRLAQVQTPVLATWSSARKFSGFWGKTDGGYLGIHPYSLHNLGAA